MNSKLQTMVSWYRYSKNSKPIVKNLIVENKYKIKLDRRTIYVGEMNTKNGFLWIMILFTIGFSNILTFPSIAYKNGSATFLCFYFLLSLFVIVPIYLLEAGLAQFYSKTAATVYKIVPIFRGLGWSSMFINICILIPSSVPMCWTLIYLVYSLFTNMPWTFCPKLPIGFECYTRAHNLSLLNKSITYLSSGDVFFEIEVQCSRKRENGMKYTFQDNLGAFQLKTFFSLIFIWAFIFLISYVILNHHFKIVYSICISSASVLILLTIRCLFLPGSLKGILAFITPDLDKTMQFDSLMDGLTHALYSSSVASATIVAIGSQNVFNCNLMRDAEYIVIGNYIVGVLSGFMQFSVYGYLSEATGTKISDLVNTEELSIVTFTETVSLFKDARLITIMFMLMLVILGISGVGVGLASFIVCLIDNFPFLFEFSIVRKNVISLILCALLCFCSLFFSFEGSVIYKSVFTHQLESVTCPLMILNEILIVHYIYGTKRFRYEMKMMFGFSYNCFWIISSNIVTPILMLFMLSFRVYKTREGKVPLWATLTSYVVTLISFAPLFTYASILIYRNVKLYKGFEIFYQSIKCPEEFGPYYKINWLLGKEYQMKLIKLRKDPKFLSTVRETENLYEVLQILRETLKKKKKEKEAKRQIVKKDQRKIMF